jgi:hypothetical protein
MPTLLLSPRHGEDSRLLWRVATQLGWRVHRVYNWQIPELSNADDIVIYGEPLLCRHLCQQLHLTAGEPPLDWLPNLPHHLRKRDVRLTTLADARSIQSRCFIKPADEKGLDAKIYQSGAELPGPDLFPDALPVLVQEVVTWRSEFRCFVLDSKVLTVAPYFLKNQIAQDDDGNWITETPEVTEAIQFANAALADPCIKPPHAFVLDVGLTQDRGWAVIEANAAFSSGIYGCDPVQALEVIRHSVRKK